MVSYHHQFKVDSPSTCKNFSEQTPGLSKDWSRSIYCSEISGKLLSHTCQIPDNMIIVLKYNIPTRIQDSFTVTMLDSNHCMGSAMFLFEGTFGRILYTGNFRFVFFELRLLYLTYFPLPSPKFLCSRPCPGIKRILTSDFISLFCQIVGGCHVRLCPLVS